jgi:spore germination protein GerM
MKKYGLLMIIMVFVVVLGACRPQEQPINEGQPPNEEQTPNEEQQPNEEQPPVVSEEETYDATLYFANNEYIMSGNENLDKVIQVTATLDLEDNMAEAVLEALKVTPEDENLSTMVGDFNFLNVELTDETAYVNIASEQLGGGSLQEVLALTQMVYTLTELPDVENVQFLVDGKTAESLMGHVSIDRPLSREDVAY